MNSLNSATTRGIAVRNKKFWGLREFFFLGLLASPTALWALEVGDVAPNFSVQASDGATYKLSDFRNKSFVVIAFFPKAFTGG